MGVTFHAEGLAYEDSYDCGYVVFEEYRDALAKAANPVMGQVYAIVTDGFADYEEVGGRDMLLFAIDEVCDETGREMGAKEIREGLFSLCPESADGCRGLWVMSQGDNLPLDIRMTFDALNAMMRVAYGKHLASFLSAPNDEGMLDAEDCRGILDDLKRLGDLSIPLKGHNYGETEMTVDEDGRRAVHIRHYPMHSQFVGMFRHCAEHNVTLMWD